ncbi:MAG: DUF1570 domain-containing protein [Phycisphaerales bacterium]
MPRTRHHLPPTPTFVGLAASVALALLTGCAGTGGGSATGDAATSAGAARGALPAALTTSPVVATREWKWQLVDGVEIDTRHWIIRSSLRSANATGTLPAFYEAALAHYRASLGNLPEPPRRLEACVFGSRDEWSRYTRHRLGDEAGPYLNMGRGGFTSGGEAVLYDIGARDTLAIAAHEGWHQYTQTTFRSALPVWLEEGIACYMEGFRMPPGAAAPTFMPWRNSERYAELRSVARKERLVPLDELLAGSPQSFLAVSRDAQLGYYAQVWALVHFLREGEGGRYRAGLERILADAVSGKLPTRAGAKAMVSIYFDTDTDRFARSYERFVGSLIEGNAWDRVIRGESPAAPTQNTPAAKQGS